MSSAEFYRKTADMFEEFKKREINLLTSQLNAKSSRGFENQLSAQEYLEKIDERSKRVDKAYNNVIARMNSLDEKSQSMLAKLNKLFALQTCMATSKYSIDSNQGNSLKDFNTFSLPLTSNFSNDFNISTIRKEANPVSTQTDCIFCSHCNNPLLSENSLIKFKSIEFLQAQDYELENKKELENNSQAVSSQYKKETVRNTSIKIRPSENIYILDEEQESSDKFESTISSIEIQHSSPQNTSIPQSDVDQTAQIQNSTEKIPPNFTGDKNDTMIESKVGSVRSNKQDVTPAFSKSDDESMNHEFDFLESEKVSKIKDIAAVPISIIDDKNSNVDLFNIDNAASSLNKNKNSQKEKIISNESPVKGELIDASTKNENPVLEKINSLSLRKEVKSDSSVSGEPNSPSLKSVRDSAPSDTDSSFETQTPITANAAYQALLGNTISQKNTQKPPSDSDSDVENALESAVRRSSKVISNAKLKIEKPEQDEPTLEHKPVDTFRRSSVIASGRPQSKLSKNTRMVLGLDVSSESDTEKEKSILKPANEDSDEFYD